MYVEWISKLVIYTYEEDIIRSYFDFNSFLKGTLSGASYLVHY